MEDQTAGQKLGTRPVTPLPEGDVTGGHGASETAPARQGRARGQRRARARGGLGLSVVLSLVVLALGFGYLTLAQTGKTLRLPTLAVAEVEARLNAGLVGEHLPPGSALVLGAVEVTVERDLAPRLRLGDMRLIDGQGRSLLAIPAALVAFDPGALLSGQIRPSAIRLSGARLAVRRDASGALDLDLGGTAAGPKSLGEVLDLAEAVLAIPAFARLELLEAEALTLTLRDDRAGRSWEVGDGRLTVLNRADAVVAELGLTLLQGPAPAQARLTVTLAKGGGGATLDAQVDRVAAADLAALAPPLAWLGFVDAPISGALAARLAADGAVVALTGDLSLAAGSLSPGAGARPVAFDRAALALHYDPATARLSLTELAVESASLRLRAQGHGDLLDRHGAPLATGALPGTVVAQIAFSEVMVDPEGLFESPVRFDGGALDLRLRLDPFRIDIGQLALGAAEERLQLSGSIAAGPGGWEGALDMGLERIDAGRLLKLWPLSMVPNTRRWFAENVGAATLTDVNAALRLVPGAAPVFSLGYEFAEAEVRLVRTLPPVLDARGHATLDGNTYTVSLDRGHVIAPQGGRIEADGSVFQVADITELPARATITLVTASSLAATLSLLDQEPFSFFSRAGQPVNLGAGRAELTTTLMMPLTARVTLPEVGFVVSGRIVDFVSPALVPGRILRAPELAVAVDTKGLTLAGRGMLDRMPVDLTYRQGFGPEQNGRARVNGTVMLSDPVLRDFGIELPPGAVAGEGPAAIDIALVRGETPRLTLTSTLVGLSLRLDALGWSKAAATRAELDLEATLGREPRVERLVLAAPGLTAEGVITTAQGGGLAEARFSRVAAGGWLDAAVTLTGNGRGQAPDVAITGGQLDMRGMPQAGAAGAGGPIAVALDRLILSQGITLSDFRGSFDLRGGFSGRFTAGVNGAGSVQGEVVPAEGGSAIRVTSDNAGTVMAAAGIFENGRGGGLELVLTPRGPRGHYDGRAVFSSLRVTGAPALAALLSAISVVGLLEQMAGDGLFFNSGAVRFILTPEAVEISEGSAVGASLGISFAGLFDTARGQLDLQGVISPVYLFNAVGQIFARPGEGLFGFNYRLTGTARDPRVTINPLSILTPGMFREIFRSAPPQLANIEEGPGG